MQLSFLSLGCMRVFRFTLAICLLVSATLANATPCTEKFGVDEWIDKYREGLRARSTVLSDIRSCVAATPASAEKFVLIALAGLNLANAGKDLTDEQRVNFVRFNANLLWILADGNDTTAQHNLAVLHNAQSGTVAHRAIKQDQSIFMYWTRKAASRDEPAAIFNLAVRLSRGVPSIGMAPSPAEAYKLLQHLERINRETNGALQLYMPSVDSEKKKLIDTLGLAKTALLDSAPIDLGKLAPAGPVDGSFWNSEENVRDAVSRLYNMVATREETGIWALQQRCYADALGLRMYMKAHEYCVAFDIANTQWSLGVAQRDGESTGQHLAKQYEKNAYLNRILTAFLQAGLTETDATNRFVKIAAIVARETEKAPEALRKSVNTGE